MHLNGIKYRRSAAETDSIFGATKFIKTQNLRRAMAIAWIILEILKKPREAGRATINREAKKTLGEFSRRCSSFKRITV